jgi:putative ABC transport system permease protein
MKRYFRFLQRPDQVAAAIDDEIVHHLDATVEELVGRGMSPADARREAERRFGDVGTHRKNLVALDGDALRSNRRTERVRDFLADTRYAARGLLREPVFTFGVAVTLGLGVAANATMFGVIDGLLLRPPPHVSADPRMTLIFLRTEETQGIYYRSGTAYPDFANLRDSSHAFDALAAWWGTEASLGRGTEARKIRLGMATGEFFRVLGTSPALGRVLGPSDDAHGLAEVPVVISHAFWQSHFGGAPDALGKILRVTSRPYTVVGVAPEGFHGPQTGRVDMWVPMASVAGELIGGTWETGRNMYWIRMVGRWKEGLSEAVAAERATAAHRNANKAAGKGDSLATVVLGSIVPSRSSVGFADAGGGPAMTTSARIATWLTGVAAVVLLIVSANVANLLLARAHSRRREIAVRLALGVRRGRLVRQLVTDSLLLSVFGGILGIGLAAIGGSVMRRTLLPNAAWETGVIDGRVLAFSLGVCAVAALLAGLAPAFASSNPDLTSSLKSGAREGGGRKRRLQRGLLVAQVALSIVLLAGAALFVRSLQNATTLELGYDADQVLVADVDVMGAGMPRDQIGAFWDAAHQQVASVPGVRSASLGVTTPFASGWSDDVWLPGRDSLPELRDKGPYVNVVTPEFLQTMGTRILRGRGLQPTDVAGGERVVVVNSVMARLLWPSGDAIGKCIKIGADTAPCTTVVGVMQDIVRSDLQEKENAQYVLSASQFPGGPPSMRSLFVRVNGDPNTVTALVRERIQSIRPDLPFAEVRTLRSIIDPEMRPWRLGATMFSIFGGLAMIVAAIGLYSVIAYDVTQRRRELGVRLALGARRGDIRRLVLAHGVGMATVGAATGLVVALLVAPRMESLLFGVGARDVLTYVAVVAVLLVTALLASLVPARRASRVAPSEVLRSE